MLQFLHTKSIFADRHLQDHNDTHLHVASTAHCRSGLWSRANSVTLISIFNAFNLSLIQHKLERGLLALGQFQHALDELLAWMSHTEELLGEQKKAGGDPKAIEIELAKHHVRPATNL